MRCARRRDASRVCFGNDRENIFRFFRVHRDVTIVKGSTDYNTAAANRLVEILKPWDTHCTIVNAAEVNKPRQLSPEEVSTWCGLDGGTRKPEDANVANVGFAVRGPVILLGTPEDNPLIKFALEKNFLPYKPDKTSFPGRGRGFMAWQRDAVSTKPSPSRSSPMTPPACPKPWAPSTKRKPVSTR